MIKFILNKQNLHLVVLIVISSFLLILINYFTIKTTSAVRAYINGESLYSKGQKDASRHLISYLYTQDDRYFSLFNEEIKVPIGDSLARTGLSYGGSYQNIHDGFLQGRNHEDDIPSLIWLFQNFKEVSFMNKAIDIWKKADVIIGRLKTLADEVRPRVTANRITEDEKMSVVNQVNGMTTQLTLYERSFSGLMGATARRINNYLFVSNLFLTILIISSVVIYSYWGTRKLSRTQHDLELTNKGLSKANQELDSFVYSASHDLKSPLNNLEGLLDLAKRSIHEGDYLMTLIEKMESSIAGLKSKVAGLTEVMKIDKSPFDDYEENSFQSLIAEFKRENALLLDESKAVITTALGVEHVRYSAVGLRSILQNLLINAMKYRSPDRNCEIMVQTFRKGNYLQLEIRDNGLGMDLEKNGHKLFKIFSRLHDHVEGTGLGLHIVKRIAEKTGGNVEVKSTPGQGSVFTVTLV